MGVVMRRLAMTVTIATMLAGPAIARDRDATTPSKALDELTKCTAIGPDQERLACFDRAVKTVVEGQRTKAFVVVDKVEVQRASDGGQHLHGRLRTPLLLEAVQIIRRHARELRHLLAAKARGAPPGSSRETDVLGLQRLAPGAEELGELRAVHGSILRARAGRNQGVPILR